MSAEDYPEGTDLSYWDDAPMLATKVAKGVPSSDDIWFDFYCPHCEEVLCIDSEEFKETDVLNEDCYHCGQPMHLEITLEQMKFIKEAL